MTDASAGSGGFDRRGVIQLAAAGAGLAGAMRAASAPRSERLADITPQPNPSFADDYNTADILVETLIAWGATHAFGVVGDGGFAMLTAEVTTAVANNLPVKVIILKNGSLAEVKFEQLEIGNPSSAAHSRRLISSPLHARVGRKDFAAHDPRKCGRHPSRARLQRSRSGRSRGRCRREAR